MLNATIEIVQDAAFWLAARCDGAVTIDGRGFNGRDARYGKRMAALSFDEWADHDVRTMYRILETYKKQLELGGFDYDEIPEPTPPRRMVHLRDGKRAPAEFTITWEKGDEQWSELLDAVKELPGRYFEWEPEPANVIPYTPSSFAAVREFIKVHGFQVGTGVDDALEKAPDSAAVRKNAAPPGEVRQEAARSEREVYLYDDKTFGVAFIGHGFKEMLAGIKQLSGRRFKDENGRKFWTVPITSETAPLITSYGKHFKFVFTAETKERINGIVATSIENFRESSAEVSDYEVMGLPAGLELMPFQGVAVEWISRNPNTIIGDQMGLGKTIEALAALHDQKAFPAVVVCPATLKYNWRDEIVKWLPGRDVITLEGREPLPLLLIGIDVVILNYDILAWWVEALREHVKPKAVIFDESHYLKNHKANRSRAAADLILGTEYNEIQTNRGPKNVRVSGQERPDIALLLTGTPILNRPAELLHPLQVIDGLDRMGGWWHFSSTYCGAHYGSFGLNMDGASNTKKLNEELRRNGLLLRRRKEQVLKELPAKRWARFPVDITNRAEYDRAELDAATWFGDKAVQDKEFLASIQDMDEDEKKAARRDRRDTAEQRSRNAEQLTRITALKRIAAEGKLRDAKNWIADFLDSGEKLVVFAWHTATVKALAAEFDAPTIMGGQKSQSRNEVVKDFQSNPDTNLIVCNLKAGGEGITLTKSSDVLFLEYPWTPAAMDQAIDRTHRIGQHNPVTGWQMMATHTIDEDIIELIEEKRQVVDAVTDGKVQDQTVSSMPELIKRLEARIAAKRLTGINRAV